MSIQNVFVMGAGMMGKGIAQISATSGFVVTLQDLSEEKVLEARREISEMLDQMVQKGKITKEEALAADSRLHTTTNLHDAADADLIIEAITENAALKMNVFRQLDAIAKPDAILASNTSSVAISEIACATTRPEQIIGTHFFYPVPVIDLLEVVKGHVTSQETIDAIYAYAETINKTTILSLDKVGFIVNRMLDLYLNEAAFILEEGVGTAEDIDKGMMKALGHKIGPLALMDILGVDILLAVMEQFYRETGDSKYRPAPLLRKMVRAGKLGRKTGEGFYKYD